MTRPSRSFGPREFATLVVALLVSGAACSVPVPTDAAGDTDAPIAEQTTDAQAEAPRESIEDTEFTPFDTAPKIENVVEVQQALEAEYPPLLRDAGIGGTVRIHFFIQKDGTLGEVRLDESSGHEALDEAALTVARQIDFTAAEYQGEPVDVWVSFPITFQVRAEPEEGS